MNIDITYDYSYLVCTSTFPYEMQILKRYLTVEISNAWLIRKKQPYLSTERCFMSEYGMIPSGLWLNVLRFAQQYNIYIEYTPKFIEYVNQFTLDEEAFRGYITSTFEDAKNKRGEPFAPRPYQINATYDLIKYRKACGEISTSAGKTLISFMMCKYLLAQSTTKKILYIVPSVDLATQSAAKYEEYESYLKNHGNAWKIGILKSGLTKKEKAAIEDCNMLFGTYQSLCKRDNNFFKDFTACIIDECHHSSATSVKNVLTKCVNLQYSFGVTGTFPKDKTIENYSIQSYIGPLVHKLSSNDLINKEKSATPIYVVFQIMDWSTLEQKKELWMQRCQKALNPDDTTLGNKLLKQENDFINSSYTRMKYIGNLAMKMAHNTLILFGDVKEGEGYGKKLYDYIKENSEKNVYYVDGTTPTKNREYYKECCENDTTGNTILVASINTFGEGVDICNIWSIFLVNSSKSERIVRQICGRGLRNYKGKDKTILYDFVDNLKYTENGTYGDNYMWKHYLERRKIYKEQNFPAFEQKISFELLK